MKRKIIIILLILTSILSAAFDNIFISKSARSVAAGGGLNAGLYNDEGIDLLGNPASLSGITSFYISHSYNRLVPTLVNESLYINKFGIAMPVKKVIKIGVLYNLLSSDFYKEEYIGLTLSKKIFHKLLLGIQLQRLKMTVNADVNDPIILNNKYSKSNINLNLGIIYLFDKIALGIRIDNLFKPNFSYTYSEPIQLSVTPGIVYKPDKPISLSLDVEYILNEKLRYSLGFEYKWKEICVRVGTMNNNITAGLGVNLPVLWERRLIIDYSIYLNSALGPSHFVTTSLKI